jgi:lysophospholipase L1-like esterase
MVRPGSPPNHHEPVESVEWVGSLSDVTSEDSLTSLIKNQMKIFFIVLGAVVLYFSLELVVLYYRSNHTPQLPHIDQSDRSLGQGPTLRYIAVGDSTGVGSGASGYETTYTYKIAQFLAKDHTVEYKNISVFGYKTGDVLNNQVKQIIKYKPDIVTISMGPNDATHLVSSNKILSNYKAIIQQLEQGTNAKIYITNIANFDDARILPWFFHDLIEYRSAKINPQILKLENDRVKLVNIHDFGWANYDRKQTYAADHFHPNDLGYENWTNAFLDKMSK